MTEGPIVTPDGVGSNGSQGDRQPRKRGRFPRPTDLRSEGDGHGTAPVSPNDPFDRIFDEDFVASARHREPSAEERLAAARRVERDRARVRLEARRAARRNRIHSMLRLSAISIVLLVAVGVVVAAVISDRIGGSSADRGFFRDDLFLVDGEVTHFPPPSPDEEDERLLPEPTVIDAEGADDHRVLLRDERTQTPVRYNPCRPIPIVIAGEERLPGGRRLLEQAIDRVTAETGLVFRIEGPTTERPGDQRAPVQERYGNRWAPVLVAFTDADTVPGLAGDVAGLGGSQPVSRRNTTAYVTGIVYLDVDSFTMISERDDGEAQMEAIIVHELGHLVGLDHAEGSDQLMYARASDQTELGVGDRAGLVEVGRGGCLPGF